MTTHPITLYPLNDFSVKVKLREINPTTGVVSPLTTGTVTAFLATSDAPTAGAADPALEMTPTHLGGGVWLIFFDATVLTAALLATHFAATPPVLVVVQPGGIRTANAISYAAARPALVG